MIPVHVGLIEDCIYLGVMSSSPPLPVSRSARLWYSFLLILLVGSCLFWVMISINSSRHTLLASLSHGDVRRAADGERWVGWEWRFACCHWASMVVLPCNHGHCSIDFPPVAAVPFAVAPVDVGFFAVVVHSCRVL